MVEAAISKAIEAKHPSRDRSDDELERPLRKHRGGVRLMPHAGRIDVFDDRDDGHSAGLEDDRGTNVERPSGLPRYERAGEPIGEDDEATHDAESRSALPSATDRDYGRVDPLYASQQAAVVDHA